jgi:hypothetical protein
MRQLSKEEAARAAADLEEFRALWSERVAAMLATSHQTPPATRHPITHRRHAVWNPDAEMVPTRYITLACGCELGRAHNLCHCGDFDCLGTCQDARAYHEEHPR